MAQCLCGLVRGEKMTEEREAAYLELFGSLRAVVTRIIPEAKVVMVQP